MREKCTKCGRDRPTYISSPYCPGDDRGGLCEWRDPDRANQPFDDVQKAKHYNTHPSGVETVDVNEWFSGNVAAAIKYVWRKDQKEPVPLRDLKKAVWYLEREQRRLSEAGYGASIQLSMNSEVREHLNDRVERVCRHDDGGLLSGVLAALMMAEGRFAAGIEPALVLLRVAVSDAERKQRA